MSPNNNPGFGDFGIKKVFAINKFNPISTEFSKGSVPNSVYSSNRESAWARWRRGYELATASFDDNNYTFPFSYVIPVASGTPGSASNPQPTVSGAFVGYPTSSKELGMHWCGWRYAGSLRCDKLTDPVSNNKLYIETVTEDKDYWYVKLKGSWSFANPLPPPFYVKIAGAPVGGIVLDPFMGSGSTGVACKHLHRKFIGIEKEQKYCEIAQKRIETE